LITHPSNITQDEARNIGLAVLTAGLVAVVDSVIRLGFYEFQVWREARRKKPE